jgi:predicted DsbA family dithiol-disulfide isomerase
MFDRVQRAHLVECVNIADDEVLRMCAREVGLDVERWERDYRNDQALRAVEHDLELARRYGVNGVPTLVIEGRYGIVGAQKYETLVEWLERIREERSR